ncbi:MAG: hypothetical protein FJ398_11970 [Verrucomicrobia bacterium]|nr:hypothetical protein [Verrucomicrobiota bacterium]
MLLLNHCGDCQMPESTLFAHVNALLEFTASLSEIQEALAWLKDKALCRFHGRTNDRGQTLENHRRRQSRLPN